MINTALVFDYLITIFNDNMKSYTQNSFIINLVILIASLIFLATLFMAFWRPYLNNLNNNIWRTKGMLNMIPIDVI